MAFSSADLFTAEEVFSNHKFVVPEFQRGYAWGKEQWKSLWDDVVNVARRERAMHYGGSIMISADARTGGEVDLIDGQQRMTSISLMLAALEGKGFPIEFRNNEPLQVYFDHYAMGKAHLAPSLNRHRSYYARNLADAARFFADQAANVTHDERTALAKTLRERFKIFVLVIQPDFDVHVAFESINNRGKPLSTLEKLKNRLIYLASASADADEGRAVAAEVHRCWKEVYASLGAGRTLLDDDEFLRAHSTGWFRHDRKAEWLTNQLFEEEFAAHSNASPSDILDYVRSLELAAACWHLINEPAELPPLAAQRLSALQKAPNATTKPLLLWALMRLANENQQVLLSPGNDTGWAESFANLAVQAERLGVLAVLANGSRATLGRADIARSAFALANPGEALYPMYLPNLIPPSQAKDAVDFATAHLRSLVWNEDNDETSGSPYLDKRFPWEGHFDPEAVETAVAKRKGAGFYDWQFGKLLVYAWEDRLRGNTGRPEKRPWDRFQWDGSVEHIYPQSPEKKDWYASVSMDGRTAESVKKSVTNSLGNLLLLSVSRNATVSNDPFKGAPGRLGKRDRFGSGSYSELQVAKLCDEWTVVQIAARGIAMLQHAQTLWDFELVPADEKLTEWLPVLFGNAADRVRSGEFSHGKKIDHRLLAKWVEKFSAPL